MARTHGLDKRLAEERMTSTQKLPKHHSYASSTQDSDKPGSVGKSYNSGANVAKGSKPAAGKGGVSVAAGPKSMGTKKADKC
jgi:hypothetical protein